MNAGVKQKQEGSQWRACYGHIMTVGHWGSVSLDGSLRRSVNHTSELAHWGGESTQLFIYLPAIISWGPSRGH